MRLRIVYLVLAFVLMLSACNLPGSSSPNVSATASSLRETMQAPTTPKPNSTPTAGSMPTSVAPSSDVSGDPYAKMTNFVDNSGGVSIEQAPATGTLVCGKKYTMTYPGIGNWKSPSGNAGVWFYVGYRYGFSDTSPEMTSHGYFSDSYLNWVGKEGAYSPGFDGRAYKSKQPVTFTFFLKCKQ